MIVLNILLTFFALMGVIGGFLYMWGIIVGALSGLAFFGGRKTARRGRRRGGATNGSDSNTDALADAHA